jgi:hypothetical protein
MTKRTSTAIKQYRIADPEHALGGATMPGESPEDAVRLYCERECHDVGDGDEINVTVTGPDGSEYEATVDVAVVKEFEVCCLLKRGSRFAAGQRGRRL